LEHNILINDGVAITVVFEYVNTNDKYSGYYYITKYPVPNYGTKLITRTLDEMRIELISVMNHGN